MTRKKRRGRKAWCHICGTKTRRPCYVIIDVGDGWRVDTCAACMKKHGWKSGQEIQKVP